MNKKHLFITGLLAGMATNLHAAITTGYGVETSAGTQSNCPSYCTGASSGSTDGGEFSTSASSSDNTYGSASSSALYSGAFTYLPELHVYASSGLGKGAGARAFGVQGYTYDGTDTSITLDFNLHGSVSDNSSGYSSNSLGASIAVIATSDLEWYADYGTLVYEVAPFGSVVGDDSVFISNGLDQNASSSITFDVIDGMDFYVVASMSATSRNGLADSSNTLTLQFENDAGLTAATQVSAVPVPAAVWLFGSGLLGLIGVARRKA